MNTKDKKRFTEFSSLILAWISVVIAAASFTTLDTIREGIHGLDTKYLVGLLVSLITAAFAAFVSLYFARKRFSQISKQRIFIIYSFEDRDVAKDLAIKLRERGYNPWVDVEEVTPGQKWSAATAKALQESAVALVIISNNFQQASSRVSEELRLAMENLSSKDETISPIIPVRIDNSPVPDGLRDVQGIYYPDPSSIDKLEKGLARIFGTK